MRLYDDVIRAWSELTSGFEVKKADVHVSKCAIDAGSHQMILRSDMAYELGGSDPSLYAIGSTTVTNEALEFEGDEICVIGPDLGEIDKDISYARLSIVKVGKDTLGDGNSLYNAIKKIDNVRYHVNPEGFMPRVSSAYQRESIRVSKNALSNGLSFEGVGNLLIRKYHENPDIEAVKIFFITEPSFDYEALLKTTKTVSDITKAIDHIMKDAMTDCNTCSLQKICDEVEGLRELHFGKS